MENWIENKCAVIRSESIMISRDTLDQVQEAFLSNAVTFEYMQLGREMRARADAIDDWLEDEDTLIQFDSVVISRRTLEKIREKYLTESKFYRGMVKESCLLAQAELTSELLKRFE